MKSKRIITFLLALIVGAIFAVLSFLPFGERFELGVLNYWFLLRGKTEAPKDIVIIAMDENSYRDLNVPMSQAWPRKLHAQLLTRLKELGAARVIFDILFLDAGADPQADAALAKAIGGLPVYLGVESAMQRVASGSGSFTLEELLEPYAPFAKAAAGLALVSLPEEDGIVRGFLTARSDRTAEFVSLAEAGAGFAVGDGKLRPVGRDLVNYFGPARTIQTLSYYQVLQMERPIPAEFVKDKVVYVGLALRTETGPAQKDVYETSYGGTRIFGAEIHATAASNLMRGDWITRLSPYIERLVSIGAAVVISFALMTLSPTVGGVVVLFTALGWAVAAFALFCSGLFIPGAALVFVILPAVYLCSTLYFYFVVRRSARQMKNAFELYLSPEMAAQLSGGESQTALGGSKLWATALFTDIAGFTDISESMPAERVAEMLNAYFTEVMEVVFQNKGTLIKFIGDAVFVLWGAPVKVDNHAELAVRTALALNKEVETFNASGRFPALKTRIGINTGPMVVGNLGSKRRFDYTAIGDSVNLASRVEGLNKYLGTTVLFTESTKKDAASTIASIPVGIVQVVGKRETINLYTSFTPTPAPQVLASLDAAFQLFRNRDWDAAVTAFEEVAVREPRLLGVSAFYRSKIEYFRNAPPPQSWHGEVEFSHK